MSAVPVPEPEEPAGSGLRGDGDGWGSAWNHGGWADTMLPGPLMAQILGLAAGDKGAGLGQLSDDGLAGFLSGSQQMESYQAWARMMALIEFASRARRKNFAADHISMALNLSWMQVTGDIVYAQTVARRLPLCFAALREGKLRPFDLKIIEEATRPLSDEDAAKADAELAGVAPGITYGALRSYAAKLALKLDPEVAKKRKEQARRDIRVRAFREDSGNAGITGREMPPVEVLASMQHIEARARALREAGVSGTFQELKARALLDLLQERDLQLTLDDLASGLTDPAPGSNAADDGAPQGNDAPVGDGDRQSDPGQDGSADGSHAGDGHEDGEPGDEWPVDWPTEEWPEDAEPPGEWPDDRRTGDGEYGDTCFGEDVADGQWPDGEEPGGEGGPGDGSGPDSPGGGSGPGRNGPGRGRGPGGGGLRLTPALGPVRPVLAALVNVTIPYTIWHGDTGPPGEIGGFGILDHPDTREAVAAAARSPDSRWCITLLDPDGSAAAHGCAPGPRHWPTGPPAPASFRDLFQILNIKTLDDVVRGSCDHAQEEQRYRPSRKLRHLVRARNATCTAPGCNWRAAGCDLDHTDSYREGGQTCPCNLAPLCRHHHRCKHSEGWWLEQPEPGVLIWHTPANRSYTTKPTRYSA